MISSKKKNGLKKNQNIEAIDESTVTTWCTIRTKCFCGTKNSCELFDHLQDTETLFSPKLNRGRKVGEELNELSRLKHLEKMLIKKCTSSDVGNEET